MNNEQENFIEMDCPLERRQLDILMSEESNSGEDSLENQSFIRKSELTESDDDEDDGEGVEMIPPEDVSPSDCDAQYIPIRPRDLSTKDIWCIEGAVLAKYSDGVGPLLPLVAGDRGVAVFTTRFSNIGPHPDPSQPHLYATIATVRL
jgi:hypothetical protein